MRWIAVATILLSSCLPAATPASSAGPGARPPPSNATPVDVIDVTDGDSFTVRLDGDEVRVRLAGINAPEHDECMGPEAGDSLGELTGGPVWLEDRGHDQFGRLLATVYSDDGFVNRLQVERGMALALDADLPEMDELIVAETAAETAGVGMWSPQACGGGPIPPLEIVGFVANPPGPDEEHLDEESITIANGGDSPVSLDGFTLRDESTANRFEFPSGTVIAPGGRLTVVTGCDPPPGELGWCSDTPVWNNGGDAGLLLDPAGRVVDHVRLP